jgi:hypothetical protein
MSATGEEETDDTEEEEIQTGNLVTQSLPHNFEQGALRFDVEDIRIDGDTLGETGDLDEDDRYLSLVDEPGWDTLELHGTIELQSDTIQDVFPPDEWDDPPGRVAVVKTNRLAIHRSREVMSDPPVDAEAMSFEIEIEREAHRGTVFVKPFLTRANERDSGPTNCASKVGARLADGDQWTIDLDEPDDGGGLLLPRFEDFSDNDRFPNERHIHHLSLQDPQNPLLYLNSGHPRVVEVLKNEGATGGPPRLRDVLYDYIEHSVWTQLLVQTARDANPDTGETKHEWEDDVLGIFLDDLYPEIDDEQDAAAQLAADLRSVEDLPTLIQNIERAVHQRYDIPTDTTKLIEEAIQNDD